MRVETLHPSSGIYVYLWEDPCNLVVHAQVVDIYGAANLEAHIEYQNQLPPDTLGYTSSLNSADVYLNDNAGTVYFCGGTSSRYVWACGTY